MNILEFAEGHWPVRDPVTGKPALIRLRCWQRRVLESMFPLNSAPRQWETFLISAPKKSGKTTINALAVCYGVMTAARETAYVVANDLDQAESRVFDIIADALRVIGLERRAAVTITRSEILFNETGSKIVAIPADFAGSAGASFGITSWTELWAYRHESHQRLWEEMTCLPNRRSLRIVDSYAGFSGDSCVLEPLWERALRGERLNADLPIYGNGRLYAYIDQGEAAQVRGWLGDPADMEGYYAEQRASLRPGTFARLHLNFWQSGEEAFITAADWDGCVRADAAPLPPDRDRCLWVGVDAATKHDAAAVVAVTRTDGGLRLGRHRIWRPRAGEALDLEATIEAFVLDLRRDYTVVEVKFDPFQMMRTAAALTAQGVRMVELPQTVGNLTLAGQTLYELVRERRLVLYPDAELRQHALNAVAVDTGRGWRLAKEKSSRQIDGLAALSFAVLAAVSDAGPAPVLLAGLDEVPRVEGGDPDAPPGWLPSERQALLWRREPVEAEAGPVPRRGLWR